MKIGVDLDNTLVSYDALFHRVALEQGAIPPGLPKNKVAVRDHLRGAGREPVWTEMQGTVYGPRMAEAEAFPGAIEFLRWASAQGIGLCIVSHKTRHPFIGPKHDLHAAARGWAERYLQGVVAPQSVFFELTLEDKLARIGSAQCTHYVDDLPEVLLAAGFPKDVDRVLFDPESHHEAAGLRRLSSWAEILAFFQREWNAKR